MTAVLTSRSLPASLAEAGLTPDASRAIGEWRDDPDWVLTLRRKGWEAWEDIPMPDRSTEGWRRADLRWMQLDQVRPAAALPDRVDEFEDLPAELLAQMPTDIAAGGVLVQRDGGTTF